MDGLFARLAAPTKVPRLLVGDLNTPRDEYADGTVETWGGLPGSDNRWDAGERAVLVGLAEHDLADAFRRFHGYKRKAFSIVMRGNKRRYDHVFASQALRVVDARYLHQHRVAKLSDHSPILVEFDVRGS